VHLSEHDLLDKDILVGYSQDKLFCKILKNPEDHHEGKCPKAQAKQFIVWYGDDKQCLLYLNGYMCHMT
jgi:hypothetical protein